MRYLELRNEKEILCVFPVNRPNVSYDMIWCMIARIAKILWLTSEYSVYSYYDADPSKRELEATLIPIDRPPSIHTFILILRKGDPEDTELIESDRLPE